MNRRIWSAVLVLCFVVAGVVGFAPTKPASATATWPVQLETDPTYVQATDSGALVAASCSPGGGYTSLRPNAATVSPYDHSTVDATTPGFMKPTLQPLASARPSHKDQGSPSTTTKSWSMWQWEIRIQAAKEMYFTTPGRTEQV